MGSKALLQQNPPVLNPGVRANADCPVCIMAVSSDGSGSGSSINVAVDLYFLLFLLLATDNSQLPDSHPRIRVTLVLSTVPFDTTLQFSGKAVSVCGFKR